MCPHFISQRPLFSCPDFQFGPLPGTHDVQGLVCFTSHAGFPNSGFEVRVSFYSQQLLYIHRVEDSLEGSCSNQTSTLCIIGDQNIACALGVDYQASLPVYSVQLYLYLLGSKAFTELATL